MPPPTADGTSDWQVVKTAFTVEELAEMAQGRVWSGWVCRVGDLVKPAEQRF